MGTRSIIVITGQAKYSGTETVRMYQHSDGYPTGVLPTLHAALSIAISQVNEANEWARKHGLSEKSLTTEHVVGKIIGESTCQYGIGCNIDQYDDDSARYDETFKPEHLGTQSDLEWIYLVDLEAKSISIYGGGYTGAVPQVAYKRKTVNPLKYADSLREEFQNEERKATLELVSKVEALGFKVNPKTKAKRITKRKVA